MKLTEQQRDEMRTAALPLMQWLADNCHPHCSAIVDSETAEIVEGIATAKRIPPFSKEWCLNMAKLEDGAEITVGAPARKSQKLVHCPSCNEPALSEVVNGETHVTCRCFDENEGFTAAVKRLVFEARISGGTAGRNESLCSALDAVEKFLPSMLAARGPSA